MELDGQSVFKTSLYLCLTGAVYVCTEDTFPIKRLQQLISGQLCLRSDIPPAVTSSLQFSDHVYIEHAADLVSGDVVSSDQKLTDCLHVYLSSDKPVVILCTQVSLQICLSHRVPLLLARGLVRLLVVDSVASLFRSEFGADDWLERTRQMLIVSSSLHQLSQEFNTPVLCINQVKHTACVRPSVCVFVHPCVYLSVCINISNVCVPGDGCLQQLRRLFWVKIHFCPVNTSFSDPFWVIDLRNHFNENVGCIPTRRSLPHLLTVSIDVQTPRHRLWFLMTSPAQYGSAHIRDIFSSNNNKIN